MKICKAFTSQRSIAHSLLKRSKSTVQAHPFDENIALRRLALWSGDSKSQDTSAVGSYSGRDRQWYGREKKLWS